MEYRKEFDGLRAIALIAVVLYHGGMKEISGAMVGVDVFFVISGFLITSLIVYGRAKDGFTLKDFYLKRARRLLPAMYLMLFICIPFSWYWLVPEYFETFSASLITSLTFTSNSFFMREIDYFSPAAEIQPLLHTWTLSIEGQYYILFPLIAVFFLKYGTRQFFKAVVVLAAISFVFGEYYSYGHKSEVYFMTITRTWQFLAGSICTLLMLERKFKPNQLLSLIGLIGIFVSFVIVDPSMRWPSAYSIIPILGTCLIILYGSQGTIANKILTIPILVWLGTISYSVYLWHQPIYAFARIRLDADLSNQIVIIIALISVFIGYLSWRFVENPLRRNPAVDKWLLVVFAGLLGCAIYVYANKGLEERFPVDVKQYLRSARNDNPLQDECSQEILPSSETLAEKCWHNDSKNKNVIIIGDSHSNSYAHELAKLLGKEDLNLKQQSRPRCLYSRRIHRSDGCRLNNEMVYNWIKSTAGSSPEIVVMANRLNFSLEDESDLEQGPDFIRRIKAGRFEGEQNLTKPEKIEKIKKFIKADIQDFLDMGKKVIIIYPVPESNRIPRKEALKMLGSGEMFVDISISYEKTKKYFKEIHAVLDSIQHPNLYRVYPQEFLCSSVKDKCYVTKNGKSYYVDTNHLSNYGASKIVPEIRNQILKALDDIEKN